MAVRPRRGLTMVGVAACVAGLAVAGAGVAVSSRPRQAGAAVALVEVAPDAPPPVAVAFEEPRHAPAATARPARRARAAPVRPLTPALLTVPAAGVRSDLELVGLDAAGELGAPRDYDLAAWWATGPKPGAAGAPAVFVGHVDSRRGPAVFHRLPGVRAGDEVVVADAAGRRLRFAVYAVERYPKSRFPTRRVYGATEAPEVRLITCGGTFDERSGHYRDNIVVFARLR